MMTNEEIEILITKATQEVGDMEFKISKLKEELDIKRERVKTLKYKLNKLTGNCYYVYVVFVNGKPKYVGKGTGNRYKHAISGTSSVLELNMDLFNDEHIEVGILFGNRMLSEKEAFKYEKDVIGSLKFYNLYNKIIPEEGEYEYMDCDFKYYTTFAIRNKDYKFQDNESLS